MNIALRIKDGIRQIHMSRRELGESEVKQLPDYAWVDEQFLKNDWDKASWLFEYRRQKEQMKGRNEVQM